MNLITKAFEITDAKISFVSLVDKAANRHKFLIAKSKDSVTFNTFGSIVKKDDAVHTVTGIVYEPMAEDTDGNYMTEDEIVKAAHWFMKNEQNVDVQHSFEPTDGATIVESFVAKSDMEIEGNPIKKGTWLMTMEINDELYDKVQKGEITGFSMGGLGKYSTVDTDITKASTEEKKSLLAKFAGLLGLGTIEKGVVADTYNARIKNRNFWEAFYSLEEALYKYNPNTERYEYSSEPEYIEEALKDFNDIVSELLTDREQLFKAVKEESPSAIIKSGKSLSAKNKECLKAIHDNLGAFLDKFNDEEKEEIDVTKEDITSIVEEVVKSLKGNATEPQGAEPTPATVEKSNTGVTKEELESMIVKAVDAAVESKVQKSVSELAEAMGYEYVPDEEVKKSEDNLEDKIAKAVAAAMKQAKMPTSMNDTVIEKSAEEHYLHGIL